MRRDTMKGVVLGVAGCLAVTSSVAYATTYLDWSIDQFRREGRLGLYDKMMLGRDTDGDYEPDYHQGTSTFSQTGDGGVVAHSTGFERQTFVGTEIRVGWADLEGRYPDCANLDDGDAADFDALYETPPKTGRHLTLAHDPCPAYASIPENDYIMSPVWNPSWPDAPTPDELLDQPTAMIENPHVDDDGLPRSAALELGGALKIRRIDRQLTPTDGEKHDPDCEAAGGCGMAYDLYVDFDGNLVVVAFDEDGNRLGTKELASRSEFIGGVLD